MLSLESLHSLQRLVIDGVPESLTLEYKASSALDRSSPSRMELVKDVTAFANSAGGQIIYGIPETDGTPQPLDGGTAKSLISREWIDQVVSSNSSPRVQEVKIDEIPSDNDPARVYYVLTIPQATSFAPHQNTLDNKYYRRSGIRAVPMYDYEIRDVMRRSATPDLAIEWLFNTGNLTEISFSHGQDMSNDILLTPLVYNRSREPAVYAEIRLYIDELFSRSSDAGLDPMAFIEGPENHRLRGLGVNWGPPRLPIFMETRFRISNHAIGVKLKWDALAIVDFYFGYEIFSPGFSVKKISHVRQRPSGRLEICE